MIVDCERFSQWREYRGDTMPITAISVEGLTKQLGSRNVLKGINLNIEEGQRAALLGPNGAGKTTLVNILCGLTSPDSGKAIVAGHDVVRQTMVARAQIGVVFQDSSLDTRLSVAENLEFHGLVYGMARKARRAQIEVMLNLVELSDWRNTVVRSLSGGMKRRLEIARALLHKPRILFLDEPTTGLDTQTRDRIWLYLDRLSRDTGLTVLVTTHYTEEVEHFDQVSIIDHGQIIANGAPFDLKAKHGTTRLLVKPRSKEAMGKITGVWPKAQATDNTLSVPISKNSEIDQFLKAFGRDVSSLEVESATLASVFLSLTGRELRDRLERANEKGRAS